MRVTEGVRLIRRSLPQGRALPEDVWRQRHRVIQTLLWLHAAGLTVFGLIRGYSLVHVLADSSIVAGATLVGSDEWKAGRRRQRPGLYICRLLVEAQGGRIWAQSAPGEGSTFTYTVRVSERATAAA